jgi:glycosyltransferase involved in cell wall biosynthesis
MHLVSTFQIKTDTKWLMRLLSKINRQEFSLTIGAFFDDGPVRSAMEKMGIDTFCLETPSACDPRAIVRLVRAIRKYQPDIIHTHLLRADILGGFAGKFTKKKIVSTVYAYGDYRRMYRRRWADWMLDRLSTCWADCFIAVCETIREDLVQRVGIDNKKIRVIQTGIDAMEIDRTLIAQRRQSLKLEEGLPVVLVSARLSYEKGVDTFLRSVSEMKKRYVRARYLIAGSGPMEPELKRMAAELGISSEVSFLGFVPDMEVVMALADLMVMPSYAEGLPNVALETFAAGRPLVASHVGGLVDLSNINKDAILFANSNNPVDLADKMEAVLKDPNLANRLSVAGRDIINKTLSMANVAGKYETVYRKLFEKDIAEGGVGIF